ncbi:DUF4214 domain-containing protein [Nitrincola alkalilacustris]|uniref:DUF4214 domain-containing protein n=1 Tax=Nitrincola alkalilacustris TaxID=1571224 RepID=UPI00124D0D63|nr:DUF4214 domain-containing protein [Nitrincola alkalilacustris]
MASAQSLEAVQKLYIAFYGRPADPGGLQFWAGRLDEANGVIQTIINSFANSTEYQERFGSLPDDALVNNLYQQAFGRPAEQAGLDYWVDQISNGAITLGELALTILDGAQNDDLAVINNKKTLAELFTNALQAQGRDYGLDQVPLAKSILDAVTAAFDVSSFDINAFLQSFPQSGTPVTDEMFVEFDANAFYEWVNTILQLADSGSLPGFDANEIRTALAELEGIDLNEVFSLISGGLNTGEGGLISYTDFFNMVLSLIQSGGLLDPNSIDFNVMSSGAMEPGYQEVVIVGETTGLQDESSLLI